MSGHSERCRDLKTYWDRPSLQCVPCPLKAGHEVTPNCGRDDYGGRHEPEHRRCKDNTFNQGSSAECRACSSCPPGYEATSPCNSTTDTVCRPARTQTTGTPFSEPTAVFSPTPTTNQGSTLIPNATTALAASSGPWAVVLVIFIAAVLVLSGFIYICFRRKRGQHCTLFKNCKRSSVTKEEFSPLSPPAQNEGLDNSLCPNVLSAPLQTVLDDLDVLEELVILLDPESHGVKNTKHLASRCSFPSTWITYTYSMKENKSPLKAVLEGVTCRHPDWTVGHLAKMLSLIERNDAVAVLAKLRPHPVIELQ